MKLKKGISFFGVFSIASGAMISSGIFILPSLAFTKVGPTVFISYFIAGLLGLLGIFSVIELSTAMPKAGGDYYFINKTFGPMLGTISGFIGWFALSLKSAFAIFGISEMIYIFTNINPLISGIILIIFFILINIIGVKEAAVFQTGMIIGLLSLMVIYIVVGFPQINSSYFTPFLTVEINQIFITAGFIFISFGGLLKVANVSEEIINPKRNIPLGLISSVVIVTILYTLITYVLTGTLSPTVFKKSLAPVADSAKLLMGIPGYVIIVIASLLAFFTTANAGIMSASRYPMALSRDQLLPHQIAVVSKKFKTPVFSIIITGVMIYLSLLLPLEMLVKSASTVILTSYVLTNFAVIILRESKITNYKPTFKAPLYPWLQIICILLFAFFIIDLGAEAIEISLGFLIFSFLVYILYGRKIKNREYAVLHLLKRITDNRLTENNLESELREILVDRDNIEQDNFDHLIKAAEIIDIERTIDFEMLMNIVAHNIHEQTDIPEKEIITQFLEREKITSTVISDFLAIPHIVFEGKDKIFLTIVRNKNGVVFPGTENKVKAIFLLGSTKEKRILHIKTLASIATLVSEKHFQEKWLNAKNTLELKNLMILSSRQRFH